MIKLEVLAWAVAAALLAGFGGGWEVNGWRLSGDLKEQQGIVATQKQSLATLEGANKNCVAGVKDVQTAVKGYIDEGVRRSDAAKQAIERAAADAKGHEDAAKSALNRMQPPKGQECATVAAEATAYAKKRKGAQ